eukprot:TRINITY_DN747_c0_g1_i7.p1 TRINITY_DN747_c0_g1~~TRINITY_DN747_c0_g1_i7.p1  ORF type:complete len:261 (-),score=40.74 TRINITY_DN747_c0_g1_i7:1430-2212(-)
MISHKLLWLLLLALSQVQGLPTAGACDGIASADGLQCCPHSCGVCGGSGCEARFPGSEDACCAANIMAANNACGTAPCVITASMEQLRTQQQPEAAALADEERPIVEVDTKLEVERQLANKRKCPNGKKVCKDRGTMNSKITCNAKNQCVCPSGYTWVTEGSPASSGYGMCALSNTACPDGINYCKPKGASCNAQNKCVCPKGSFFKPNSKATSTRGSACQTTRAPSVPTEAPVLPRIPAQRLRAAVATRASASRASASG